MATQAYFPVLSTSNLSFSFLCMFIELRLAIQSMLMHIWVKYKVFRRDIIQTIPLFPFPVHALYHYSELNTNELATFVSLLLCHIIWSCYGCTPLVRGKQLGLVTIQLETRTLTYISKLGSCLHRINGKANPTIKVLSTLNYWTAKYRVGDGYTIRLTRLSHWQTKNQDVIEIIIAIQYAYLCFVLTFQIYDKNDNDKIAVWARIRKFLSKPKYEFTKRDKTQEDSSGDNNEESM